jgi:DNA replicative helicase MCM subunit Mcm2 (Cdc46/Mcm family)
VSQAIRDIPTLGLADLGLLVEVAGRVTKVGPVRRQVRIGAFSCRHCRTEIVEPQDDATAEIRFPLSCHSDQGGCGVDGHVEGFDFLNLHSTHEDWQEVRVGSVRGGRGIAVLLKGELLGSLSRGAQVVLQGRIASRHNAGGSSGSEVTLVLLADRVL